MLDVEAGSYDSSDDSSFYRDDVSAWTKKVTASRDFRKTASGKVYNYRNKVLMGLGQTRILNDPPSVTPKEEVTFTLPDVALPDTDEGIMMLSILEMQSLLRPKKITSVQLARIAIDMLEKYDPEYNMVEVPTFEIALETAAAADALFANDTYISYVQGIPFAIKVLSVVRWDG